MERYLWSTILQDTEEMTRKAIARVATETILRSKINKVASKYKNWNQVVAKFCDGNDNGPKNKAKGKTNVKGSKSTERPDMVKQKISKAETRTDKPAKAPKKEATSTKKPQAVATPKTTSVVRDVVKTSVVKQLQDLDELEKLDDTAKMEQDVDVPDKPSKKDSFFLTSDGYEVSSEEEPVADSESEAEEEFQDRSYKSRAYHVRNKDNTEKKPMSMGSLNRQTQAGAAKNIRDL